MTVTYVVEQEMTADNDTLVITDPCYLMADEHWEQWLEMEFSGNPIGLDNYLRQYHNFGDVIASDTGVGDWSNKVYNVSSNATVGQFSADAGMVICAKASDLKNYGADFDKIKDYAERGLATIIENYSGHINLCYETRENEDGFRLAVLEAVGETDEDINWSTEHLADN